MTTTHAPVLGSIDEKIAILNKKFGGSTPLGTLEFYYVEEFELIEARLTHWTGAVSRASFPRKVYVEELRFLIGRLHLDITRALTEKWLETRS